MLDAFITFIFACKKYSKCQNVISVEKYENVNFAMKFEILLMQKIPLEAYFGNTSRGMKGRMTILGVPGES